MVSSAPISRQYHVINISRFHWTLGIAQQIWCAQSRIAELAKLVVGSTTPIYTTALVIVMEGSEKWCDIQDNCDLPISNGLLTEAAVAPSNSDYYPLSRFDLRSVESDLLGGNATDLINSTCHYPFCVALLSFTIKNTK